jgi:arsenical pump membrane protein
VRLVVWAAAALLVPLACWLRPGGIGGAALATIRPFGTLAAIIAAGALADRAGVFRRLGRVITSESIPERLTPAAILASTALLSALVNLDVAVVVAMPVALHAARPARLDPARLSTSVAITANTASFLLPTSNVTSLLLLARRPLPTMAYLGHAWLPWLLTVAVTITALSIWLNRSKPPPGPAGPARRPAWAMTELIAMFLAASAIRAISATSLTVHGFGGSLALSLVLTCAASNLPAAAAIAPAGLPALWAAILATTIGSDLLITGSIATLICRRLARDYGARLRAWQFTAIGLALLPAQLAVAVLGLQVTGAFR